MIGLGLSTGEGKRKSRIGNQSAKHLQRDNLLKIRMLVIISYMYHVIYMYIESINDG